MGPYNVISCVLIMCLCIKLLVHSEEVPLSTSLTIEDNNSCSNGTGGSDDCPDTSNVTDMSTTLEDDSTTVYVTTEFATNTTAALASNLTTPANKTVMPNSTEIELTTVATEVTSVANTSTVNVQHTSHLPTSSTCFCDLTMNLCDISCCCDSECSAEDRLVFLNCHQQQPNALDPRYCYQTQFIYHNNTELKMSWFKDGLFCILEDNLPATVHYRSRNKVSSLKEFNSLYDSGNTYVWPIYTIKQHIFHPLQSYTEGSVIWSLQRGSLLPLDVPIKVANTLCQSSKALQYLQDYVSSCSRVAPGSLNCERNEDLNSASYYKNISIIANPDLINQTKQNLIFEQCVNTSCIPITSFFCLPELEMTNINNCEEATEIPSPVFNSSLEMCQNVVQSIRYMVFHNGTKGIIKVCAYITLANVSSLSIVQFSQYFSVEFRWANEQKIFKRSGRPGYLVGRPVMAGHKVKHAAKEDNGIDKVGIDLSYDPMHWLSIPAVKKDGTCDWFLKLPVTFGDNRRSTCLLPLRKSNFTSTSNCALLQRQILSLLAGDAITNITESKKFNRYVATFGDSMVENVGDWVQVLLVSLPTVVTSSSSKNNNQMLVCKSIVASMHIDIIFANVGALANPQAKILGVAFRFGKPHDLVFACTPVQCSAISENVVEYFNVLSSVSFVDVTQPAETYFSEPPVYEVKLSYDFFYPFFSGTVIPKLNKWILVVTLLMSQILIALL